MAATQKQRGQLSPGEISAFCAQLALIIRAGIPVQEGIAIMAGDEGSGEGREILNAILEQVEEGRPLAFALEQCGRFPRYMVNMVEIGEASGRLDEVLDSLCGYYERSEGIARSIRTAVTYPMVMIVMMAVVITVLVVKVLPIFRQVFRQLGTGMSAFSQGVLDFGSALGGWAAGIVAVVLALALAAVLMRQSRGGRAALGRLANRLPWLRGVSARIAAGRFASAMSLTLSSGLDADQSLDMARQLVGDDEPTLRRIEDLQARVAGGSSFADALAQAGLFTGVYAQMVAVGFKTGAVDAVMKKIADRYEEEIDAKISGLLSVLEPTLVAVLSIVVGMILLSVMLPLMGVMSSIG